MGHVDFFGHIAQCYSVVGSSITESDDHYSLPFILLWVFECLGVQELTLEIVLILYG